MIRNLSELDIKKLNKRLEKRPFFYYNDFEVKEYENIMCKRW